VDIENPLALHFIMQDELFFLKEDREKYITTVTDTAAVDVAKEETPVGPEFAYMGKKGGMLILVHYADHEFIHEIHLSALENIFKRKEIAISDAAILNLAKNNGAEMKSLLEFFDPGKILILGEHSIPVGMNKPTLNQPKQSGKRTLLYSFSFDEMMDSPENKKAFWEQMKNF